MRNVRQSANEAQTRHPPWATSRGARHCSRDRSLSAPPPLRQLSASGSAKKNIVVRYRDAIISPDESALFSERRWEGAHASWPRGNRYNSYNERASRGRAPSSRAARASRSGPHPGPRAPCNPPLRASLLRRTSVFFFDTDYCTDRAYPMRNGTI